MNWQVMGVINRRRLDLCGCIAVNHYAGSCYLADTVAAWTGVAFYLDNLSRQQSHIRQTLFTFAEMAVRLTFSAKLFIH